MSSPVSVAGMGANETELVMELLETLERRQCNGHATVRLGTALADPDTFADIFTEFSRGTYFEHVGLDVEVVDPVISCGCGYRARPTDPAQLSRCPRCGGRPDLVRGTEFEILEPEPEP